MLLAVVDWLVRELLSDSERARFRCEFESKHGDWFVSGREAAGAVEADDAATFEGGRGKVACPETGDDHRSRTDQHTKEILQVSARWQLFLWCSVICSNNFKLLNTY